MVHLNITIPEDVAKQLKSVKSKSRFITEAVKEKFQEQNRRCLEAVLIEGYKKMAAEDKLVNEAWEGATLEGHWL